MSIASRSQVDLAFKNVLLFQGAPSSNEFIAEDEGGKA